VTTPLPAAVGPAGRSTRPRVISASKRTDIPAFYLRWFADCCDRGSVDVPNPRYHTAADPLRRWSHVSLRPEHVLAVVWWSKNYTVYERLAPRFAAYAVQHFHFTINPRRADLTWLEPDLPPLDEVYRQVRFLAGLPGGPERITWRYDPLCFWSEGGQEKSSWDSAFFEETCRALASLGVRRCVTSLADPYARFRRRMRQFQPDRTLREPADDEVTTIAAAMVAIAGGFGVEVAACTEPRLAACPGLVPARCIDGPALSPQASARPATDTRMRGREACGCTLHTDVGDYQAHECGYACIYCYANPNPRRLGNPRLLPPP
jgi:hypothetical protein